MRDFAQVKGNGCIDLPITQYALEALNIDKYGLDEIDNKILLTIIDKFKGWPRGHISVATAIGEDSGTVEEVYEPYLIERGIYTPHTARTRGDGKRLTSIWDAASHRANPGKHRFSTSWSLNFFISTKSLVAFSMITFNTIHVNMPTCAKNSSADG